MEQKKVIRDFKVLTEQISPDNVAVMAELIAMRETKALIGYYVYYAEKAHKNLCRDIFGKHEPGYIFSDSYDFVQSVALFLCAKAWRYSYAATSESIWTTSCISPKKASRER